MIYAPNRNYVWTYTFVEALAQAGLRHVVIAPGSRSTPLTMAFAQHPHIRVYSHIDERGAAFMALGLALAEDAPAAVVCSSGTAAANFFPAIVEAHYAHVPLLVLTADRPHELRDSGANQTVDQVKLYGDQVLWSVDVALPEANPPDVALRNLRSLAARAVALADGMPKGAVHLNFPFRKPLEPTAVAGEGRDVTWGLGLNRRGAEEERKEGVYSIEEEGEKGSPFTRLERGGLAPKASQVLRFTNLVRGSRRGLIICGPRTVGHNWFYGHGILETRFTEYIDKLASITGFTVLADPLSGVRYGECKEAYVFYDTYLRVHELPLPDTIIHFGGMPLSQSLQDYLSRAKQANVIWVEENGTWSDADHKTQWYLQCDPRILCDYVIEELDDTEVVTKDQLEFRNAFRMAELATHRVIQQSSDHFDGMIFYDVTDSIGISDAAIVSASSLAIRHLDQFGGKSTTHMRVFCNRGASGIDGTISTAIGVAVDQRKFYEDHCPGELIPPTVLIIGDLAFYHDMNALLAAKRNGINNLVIVLLNNNGGQIFRRLPINKPEFEPHFTELFTTPHGMTFEHTAAQFGFAYARADDRKAFKSAFTAALASGQPSIVEVVTDAEEDAKRRKALMDKIAEAVKVATAGERE